MDDYLYRGVFSDQKIRFSYALTTDVVNRAVLAHGCDPVSAHILGRALTSAVLISPLLTDDERFTLRWNYSGVVKSIVIDVGAKADVRGFIAPNTVDDGATAETELYGDDGKVILIKSSSEKVLSTGVTEAQLMDVVEDLTMFFAISDQIETAILALIGFSSNPECPVAVCQGIMIQAMPDCDLTEFDEFRNRLSGEELRRLVGAQPEIDNYFERVLSELSGVKGVVPRAESCPAPTFLCNCNRDKILDITGTLADSDIEELANTGEKLTVKCQFCSRDYRLTAAEISTQRKRCN